MRAIIDWIIRLWLQMKLWYRHLLPLRFSFIAVAVFALCFIAVPQGQDALRFLGDEGWPEQERLLWCALGFASATWYVSRQLLHVRFPDEPPVPRHSWIITWMPRLLGAAVLAILAFAIRKAEGAVGTWVWIYAILAIAFLIATAARRKAIEYFSKEKESARTTRQRRARELPFVSMVFLAAVAVEAFVFFALACTRPVWLGDLLHAPGVVAVSLTGWVIIGSMMAVLGGRMRFPIGTALLIYAFLISPYTENHRVRELGALPPRPTLAVYHQQWQKAGGKPPYFVVATEGGGIRAAYWTTIVLNILDARTHGEFSKHLIAISGASGGSVGAAVYATALREPDAAKVTDGFYESDTLAPLLATMLQNDFAQRVLPLGFRDRAWGLETSWEHAWKHGSGNDAFAASFLQRMQPSKDRPIPALFLNATLVENGARAIGSNVRVCDFNNAADSFELVQRDMSVSTTAHLSARFPYISPAGTVTNRGSAGCAACDVVCCRIVDGGYFDNSGAVTASEVVGKLHAIDAKLPIYAIVINYGSPASLHASSAASQLLAPPLALYRSRDARGTMGIEELKVAVGATNVIPFTLSQAEFPLGWLLSNKSRSEMQHQAAAAAGTARVKRILGVP